MRTGSDERGGQRCVGRKEKKERKEEEDVGVSEKAGRWCRSNGPTG
jgi:hypothetical protein